MQLPSRGKPARYESVGACGWVFSPADVFDESRLLQTLSQLPGVTRYKGVFRVEDEWIAMNYTGGTTTCRTIAYRRDSRVEVFAEGAPDAKFWGALEAGLIGCLI